MICDCEVCKRLKSYHRMKKSELIDVIHNMSFDLQFTELYESTLYDTIKYITPDIWEKSSSSLDAIGKFQEYLNKIKMLGELQK